MTSPVISLRHVHKAFGKHQALADVSLDIAGSETVVVLGPSGCGKTTLLRLLAGLDTPDVGEIWLAGAQVGGPRQSLVPAHTRGIGFVFQDLALWPHLTVRGNLDFVLGASGLSSRARVPRIYQALALVRIDSLADRYPHQLSGGEQQRVALARALVGQPRVLLLDEPLSSLDPDLRAALREELTRVQRALGFTMVYVTHDRGDAAALADRIVEMRAGRIVGVTVAERSKERL